MRVLETDRLMLRPFAEADIPTIYQLVYADQDVRRWWSNFTGTMEELRERFRTSRTWQAQDGFGYRAVVRRDDAALLGLIGYYNYHWGDASWLLMPDGSRDVGRLPGRVDVELTYALGQAYWRQGYATEAGRALVAYGFTELGIDRIINAISLDNERSHALMTRLGFTFLDNGVPQDVIGILVNPKHSAAFPDYNCIG